MGLRACLVCGRVSPTKLCEAHGGTDRLTFTQRGYRREFQRTRRRLLAQRPLCDCGQPATVAHHDPPRRTLVAQGVADPDALEWLHPKCRSCHASLSARGF